MTSSSPTPEDGSAIPSHLLLEEREIDLSEILHGTQAIQDVMAPPSNETMVTAQRVVDCSCLLGECVIYDDIRNAVMWTDIYGKKFHKLQLGEAGAGLASSTTNGGGDEAGGGQNSKPVKTAPQYKKLLYSVYQLPKMLCSFGLLHAEDDDTIHRRHEEQSLPLLCAWEDGFQIYDVIQGKALSEMSTGDVDIMTSKDKEGLQKEPYHRLGDYQPRLNDGRTDRDGLRYVCGGYYGGGGNDNPHRERVYKVEQDTQSGKLVHEPIVDDIRTTNSICWSLDGTKMYLADSGTRQIHSYAYDKATGTLSDKTLLNEKPVDEHIVPDGSCVDTEGYVWNACWYEGPDNTQRGMVQRICPTTGHVVYTVHIPDIVSQISSCCFGGENFDILFITSAREGPAITPKSQPHAGALYAAKIPFTGRKESRLKFTYSTTTTNGDDAKDDEKLKRKSSENVDDDNKDGEQNDVNDGIIQTGDADDSNKKPRTGD